MGLGAWGGGCEGVGGFGNSDPEALGSRRSRQLRKPMSSARVTRHCYRAFSIRMWFLGYTAQ